MLDECLGDPCIAGSALSTDKLAELTDVAFLAALYQIELASFP